MRAVFLDYESLSDADLSTESLSVALPDLVLHASSTPAQTAERIADAWVVLVNTCVLTREHLEAARHLKLICIVATGTDNVDLRAAGELGIAVCNVPSYCRQSVTQHVWSLILGLTQHVEGYSGLVKDGSWVTREAYTAHAYPIRELAGRTFGVIGWGELGRGSARIAEAFGMQVIIANRRGAPRMPGRCDLDELLAQADVVSLHCPLTDVTRNMIGRRELALMKPDALLINTARGGLIDGRALADALQEGRLAGAGIDVLPQEPPVDGDPLLAPGIPNLLLTPHVAWAAREARQRCLDETAANVVDFLAGGNRARVA